MRRLLPALLALALSLSPAIEAQTALPFLEIAPTELGGAGVSRPDVQTFVQNPALLGLLARDTRAAASGTPLTDWLGELDHGSGAALVGVTAGPVAVGAGLSQGRLRGEQRRLGDGTLYRPADRYRALSLGAATTGPVRLAVGATGRLVSTIDAPVFDGERFSARTLTGATLDLGVAVAADLDDVVRLPRLGPLAPAVAVRAGYAQTHIGGMVRYAGLEATPLPRTAALGWSATAGLDLPTARGAFRVAELEVSTQAEQSLVQMDAGKYAALGHLSPLHAAAGSGDASTTGRRGARVVLAETLALSTGRYDGWGYDDVRSHSVELRAGGALRLLARVAGSPRVDDLARRVDFRVGRLTTYVGTADESSRTQLSLVVRR